MKIFKLLVAIVSFGFAATEASAQLTKITTSMSLIRLPFCRCGLPKIQVFSRAMGSRYRQFAFTRR
jgi:hypothetical protein